MKKLNMSTKRWIMVIGLAILSVIAIRFNTKPKLYVGYLFSLIGIFFIGLNLNKLYGAITGGGIVALGLLVRKFYPEVSKLTGEKLEAFMVDFNNYQDFIGKFFLLFIAIGALIGFIGGAAGEIVEEDRTDKFSTNRITYIAIFVALSVAINTARVGSISFGGFPIIMSGYFLGPINGFIVGAVADVVGFIIRPSSSGGFNPAFVLTSALTGAIPVVVTRFLGEKYPNFSLAKVIIGTFVGQMVTSVIMVPFFRVFFFGGNTFLYFAGKAFIKQIISIPIYGFLITTVNESLKRTVNFDKKIRN